MADTNVKFKTLRIQTGKTGTGITSGYLATGGPPVGFGQSLAEDE